MIMEKPRWIDETPEIAALLSGFLDKLDRKPLHEGKMPEIRINKKTATNLYRLDETSQQQWLLLKTLSPVLFKIILFKKRGPYDPEFHFARLIFEPSAEPVLRDWFDRPQGGLPMQRWREAVSRHQHEFPGDPDFLMARRFDVEGMNQEDIVQALVSIKRYQQQSLTLRQLSALCFRGYSKVLDNKEELVYSLFPQINVKTRPVLVNVYLPNEIDGVLFIENQDSFNTFVDTRRDDENMAVVYCAGFQGTAQRIRDKEGVSLHYQGKGDRQLQFENWWFTRDNINWSSYFWGDLDFAGMTILKTLRQRFKNMQAWQSGYEPMRLLMERGGGYTARQRKKVQADSQCTGCDYADRMLLPLLRDSNRCIDQEVVMWSC